jgi:hypothetical protein
MKTTLILLSLLLSTHSIASIYSLKCVPENPCHEYANICIFSFMLHYRGESKVDVELTRLVDGEEITAHYSEGDYFRDEIRLEVSMDDLDTWVVLKDDNSGNFNGHIIFEEDFLFENVQCKEFVPSLISPRNIVIIPGDQKEEEKNI